MANITVITDQYQLLQDIGPEDILKEYKEFNHLLF